MCGSILCLACVLTDFAIFYTNRRSGWAVIVGDALRNARRALRADFSFGLSWPPPSLDWPSVSVSANVQLAISFCFIALQEGLVLFGVLYHKHGLGRWGESKKHARPVVWMQRLLLQISLGIVLAIDRVLRPKGDYGEERPDIVEWEPILEYARRMRATELKLDNCGLSGERALSLNPRYTGER